MFSAFLLNDAICLVMTPLVVDIAKRLRRDPVPYLLAVAMASNIGSVATITGNPQNMMIGSFSGIPYGRFAAHLTPPAVMIGLVLTIVLLALFYRREFSGGGEYPDAPPVRAHYAPAAWRSNPVLIVLVMMAAFFAGQPPAKVALIAGGFMLLVTRVVRSERVYREIDWPLLLMFAGLFVVVGGFEKALLTPDLIERIGGFGLDRMPVLGIAHGGIVEPRQQCASGAGAEAVSGAPTDPQRSWLVVAMASTFAGNLTVLGSVANLIVVQQAAARGVSIGFWEYFRVGAPLTLLTIAFGLWWL